MDKKTIETKNLPDSQSVRYSRQFAIGRLYKSQNGGEWNYNDYQDMKFKLYKANFTSTTGSVLFHNPTLNESNGYVQTLRSEFNYNFTKTG
jgi:virulence-associated protein VapD